MRKISHSCTNFTKKFVLTLVFFIGTFLNFVNAQCNLQAYISSIDPTCAGAFADGQATAVPQMGTAPYDFLWNTGATTMTITGLTAGIYMVTITDAAGCEAMANVVLLGIGEFTVNVLADYETCDGAEDGVAIVDTVIGGVSPFTFQWDDPNNSTNQAVTGLSVGTYHVTVTDATGCSKVESAEVELNPEGVWIMTSSTDVICFGQSNGSAHAGAMSGTPPFNYQWDDPNNTVGPDIVSVGPGTYTVTVTDANGCSNEVSAHVTEPPALVCSIVLSPAISCAGAANGQLIVSVTGGTPPYSYQWGGGQTNQTLPNITGGTYSVSVTDANGCICSKTVTVTEPAALECSIVINGEITCPGANDGQVTVVPTGGTAPYSVDWSNGETTGTISNLGPGTYDVTIVDANGCPCEQSVTLTEGPELECSINIDQEISCAGGDDGQLTAQTGGGVGPFDYLWSNGKTTQTISDLGPGTYDVTIIDANGCICEASATLTQGPQLECSVNIDREISCAGLDDGQLTAESTGGTMPFNYIWSNGKTTKTISDLGPGTYVVTITDAGGCECVDSATLSEPPSLNCSINVDNPLECFGDDDGKLTATANGGNPPYSFAWSNGGTTSMVDGLGAGTYTVIVTDSNDCPCESTVTLTEPPGLECTVFLNNEISCFGANDGKLTAMVAGGAGPYTFAWNTGDTTAMIDNLGAGTYDVTITDANGCFCTKTVTLTEPTELNCSVSIVNQIECFGGSNGKLTATANGGTPAYSFLWSTGATTSMIDNLGPGTYIVTITDANGCVCIDSAVLTEPAALECWVDVTEISCPGANDGSMTVNVGGGNPPFDILWNTGATTATINNLSPGTYTVTVIDANDCVCEKTMTLEEPPALLCDLDVDSITCEGANDGALTVSFSGGTQPFAIEWSTGATNVDSITGLGPGTYSVTVTDSTGCQCVQTATLTEPVGIECSLHIIDSISCFAASDGQLFATASGGTPPYDILWSTGATTTNISSLGPGTYSVSVTDANGCVCANSLTVSEPAALECWIDIIANASCEGGNDGEMEVNTGGGTPPYTIEWSTGANSLNISGLTAGSYTVSVTDAHGCFCTKTMMIEEDEIEAGTVSVLADPICIINGAAFITGIPNGDTTVPTGYQVIFILTSGPDLIIEQIDLTPDFIVNNPGLYTIHPFAYNPATLDLNFIVPGVTPATAVLSLITQGGGNICADLNVQGTQVNVVGPEAGTLTADSPGECLENGQATISATPDGNAMVPVDYDVLFILTKEPGAVIQQTSSLPLFVVNDPGTYTIHTLVYHPDTLDLSFIVFGTTPLIWLEDMLVQNGGPICASLDAMGAQIVVSPALEVFLVKADVSCFGADDGSLTVVTGNGTPPFTYQWSIPAGSTNQLNNLPPGSYCVTVTDANGCTGEDCAVIKEPTLVVCSSEIDNEISCFGATDGIISVSASGGEPPYTFLWNSGHSGASNNNLGAGTYMITTTDDNGCTCITSITLSEPPPLICQASVTSIITTIGGSDGEATVTAVGGTPPYSYLWSNGQTTATATGLSPGTYTVTVTDAHGCICVSSVTLFEPAKIGNFVWFDTNEDGLQDSTEAGVEGIKVIVFGFPDAGGTYTDSMFTDSTGMYMFPVPPGVYKVTFVLPPQYEFTLPNEGFDETIDSDADPDMGGMTNVVNVNGGDYYPHLDAGVVDNCIDVGDYVWFDVNRDGLQDPVFEGGIPDVEVFLIGPGPDSIIGNANDVIIDTAYTDQTGHYLFKCLGAGEYKIMFNPASFTTEYDFTIQNAGNDDEIDSDADTVMGMTDPFTIVPNQDDDLSFDAGLIVECLNLLDGGEIGYNQTICAGFEADILVSITPPSGGVGPIEYLWMKSTIPGPFNPNTWEIIPNSNMEYLALGQLYQTTFFIRCARREGCTSYKESNMVVIKVIPFDPQDCPPLNTSLSLNLTNNGQVMLSWTSSGELAGLMFVPEKSGNGDNFDDLDQVPAFNNENGVSHYTYLDESPRVGSNYYRLRIENSLGEMLFRTEAEKIILEKDDVRNFALYPNPFGKSFRIVSGNAMEEGAVIEIFSSRGMLVASLEVEAGKTIDNEILMPGAPRGVYLVKVRFGETKSEIYRMIKIEE